MSKIIDAVVGDGKTATPAKKYVVYAGIVTFVALVAAIAVLVISSIVFAVRGDAPEEPVGDQQQNTDNDTGVSTSIEYAATTADALKAKLDGTVEFKSISDRAIAQDNKNLYYAKKGEVKLTAGASEALHKMMVDFYTANKASLKTNIDKNDCNIPLVKDASADGIKFSIVDFSAEKSIAGVTTYTWIFNNAYKYGFIYDTNTFTYVGVAAANYHKMGTLATLVNKLSAVSGTASVNALSASNKTTSYQLYYVSVAGELKVPTNYEYSVIANGNEGYVIVVDMSKKVATSTGGAAG